MNRLLLWLENRNQRAQKDRRAGARILAAAAAAAIEKSVADQEPATCTANCFHCARRNQATHDGWLILQMAERIQ